MTTRSQRKRRRQGPLPAKLVGQKSGSGVEEALTEIAKLAGEIGDKERRLQDLVGGARRAKATWRQIGDALGVSPQAVQQRYRPYWQKRVRRAVTAGRPAAADCASSSAVGGDVADS
jgi:hypothetical protein